MPLFIKTGCSLRPRCILLSTCHAFKWTVCQPDCLPALQGSITNKKKDDAGGGSVVVCTASNTRTGTRESYETARLSTIELAGMMSPGGE